MAQNNERNPHTVLIHIGAVSTTSDVKIPGMKLLRDAVILDVSIMDSAALAADNTNKATIKLLDVDNTNAVIASGDSSASSLNGLSANLGKSLVLAPEVDPLNGNANAPLLVVDKGHSLAAEVITAGTAALTNAMLQVTLHYL